MLSIQQLKYQFTAKIAIHPNAIYPDMCSIKKGRIEVHSAPAGKQLKKRRQNKLNDWKDKSLQGFIRSQKQSSSIKFELVMCTV